MTLLELLLGLMMTMDIPYWGWCPWTYFGLFPYVLQELHMFKTWLKSVEVKDIKIPFKDWWHCSRCLWSWWWLGHSWMGLVSLMTHWIGFICSEEAMFEIWLKFIKVKGIKNPFKYWWYGWSCCWSWRGLWMLLTGASVLHDVLDCLYMLWGSHV